MPFTLNQTPATNDVFLRTFILLIISAGGAGVKYSNGSSVSSGAPAAGALDNNNAWALVTLPDGSQWCWQRGGDQNNWRITMSPTAGFGDGSSGTSTQAPTASDRQVLCGGGTEGSPSFETILPNEGTYRAQYFCASSSPWGMWAVTYPIGGGPIRSVMEKDPLFSPIASPAADADPFAYAIYGSNNAAALTPGVGITGDDTNVKFYFGRGTGGEVFTSGFVAYLRGASGSAHTSNNPQTLQYDSYPYMYVRAARQTGVCGFKGMSRLHQWSFTDGLTTPGDGVNQGGTLTKINFSSRISNWDGTTTPLA